MMSFIKEDGKIEQILNRKSSDSEDNYQTDEEIDSEESFLGPLKNIVIGSNRTAFKAGKNTAKSQLRRRSVPPRYNKYNRQFGGQARSRKTLKQFKKTFQNSNSNSIKEVEIPKKGKRCFLGGKAKGKPLEEGNNEKHGSDDESDNFYIARISLGYFQKFKDKSGASTSNQWEEDYKNSFPISNGEKTRNSNSDESELLELQKWARAGLVSICDRKSDDLKKTEDVKQNKL